MSRNLKFNLFCDGHPVRTLDELQEYFSIDDILDYYNSPDKTLHRWLSSRGYDQELEQIEAITSTDTAVVIKELCNVFHIAVDDNDIEAYLHEVESRKIRQEKSTQNEQAIAPANSKQLSVPSNNATPSHKHSEISTMEDRFDGIDVSKFKGALHRAQNNLMSVRAIISSIPIENDKERQLKNELVRLCEFWKRRFEDAITGSMNDSNIGDFENLSILRNESIFVKGLLFHRVGQTEIAAEYYNQIADVYIPAKIMMKFTDAGSFHDAYKIEAKRKKEADTIEIVHSLSGGFYFVGIFIFIIKHIFDTLSYYKL